MAARYAMSRSGAEPSPLPARAGFTSRTRPTAYSPRSTDAAIGRSRARGTGRGAAGLGDTMPRRASPSASLCAWAFLSRGARCECSRRDAVVSREHPLAWDLLPLLSGSLARWGFRGAALFGCGQVGPRSGGAGARRPARPSSASPAGSGTPADPRGSRRRSSGTDTSTASSSSSALIRRCQKMCTRRFPVAPRAERDRHEPHRFPEVIRRAGPAHTSSSTACTRTRCARTRSARSDAPTSSR